MPLIAHRQLPAYSVLRDEGIEVTNEPNELACLHVGLLNLMPDAAFEATERQWIRLCSRYSEASICVFPFTFNAHERSPSAQVHIARYYETATAVQGRRLDLLIVTGANPKTPDITKESFWRPMIDTIKWTRQQACPVVCSCLATHAVVKEFYGVDRIRLPQKCWGVYPHVCLDAHHPLVQNAGSGWDGPHSHVYGVTRQQLQDVGIQVLVDSSDAGVYVAASEGDRAFVFLQGHPEYDANSLLKEFKREVQGYIDGFMTAFPRLPENYFASEAIDTIEEYRNELLRAKSIGGHLPDFPERRLLSGIQNSWQTTGRQLFNNVLREAHHAQ